jgi:hypothetical protein
VGRPKCWHQPIIAPIHRYDFADWNVAVPLKKPPQKNPKPKDLDLDPDAWPKFEDMIRKVSKAGPQHRGVSKASKAKDAK